jgi:hypothetical protein
MKGVPLSILVVCLLVQCADQPVDRAETLRAVAMDRWAAVEETEHRVVIGKNGWLFFGPELRHIGVGQFWGSAAGTVSMATRREHADPFPAITDFKAQLDSFGIDLLLVPVPPKAMVYPEKLLEMKPFEHASMIRLDPLHQAFYEILRKEGIAVVDLIPRFLEARDDSNGPLYCKTDTHWSSNGCVVAAQAIAKEIRRFSWFEPSAAHRLTHEWRTIQISGDLWIALGRHGPRETVRARFIGEHTGAGIVPISPDRTSPIVLLGDSHNLVFRAGDDMHAAGAGLADQLALELGHVVDLVAVRGSGATPARVNLMRRARSIPDYLAGKRLIIWCFSAREFTESPGWQKVPLKG